MFAIDDGEGDSVLLLHGSPSSIDVFDALVAELRTRWRVIVPELPGYGRSPPRAEPRTFPRIRAAIEELLTEKGITRTAVIGFSGGGYRACELALAGNIQVTKLVLLSSAAHLTAEARDQFRRLASVIRTGAALRDLMPPMLSEAFAAKHPEYVERVRAWATAAPAAVLADELQATAEIEDLRHRLAGVRIPVLLRVGELDVVTPPDASRELARLLPHARLEIVSGAGHVLLFEDREATIESIVRFLGE